VSACERQEGEECEENGGMLHVFFQLLDSG
jgi:hypothetical protein